MNNLYAMIWIEFRKAIRSRMPLWTSLGSLFMPLGIAMLILVAKNPEISEKLGLISAKANLMAYSATNWSSYLVLFAEIVSAGEFFFFILAISWVFGREFADGTLKDMLAVPVHRYSIVLAKFILAFGWCAVMAILVLIFGLITGAIIQLPGGSLHVILQGIAVAGITVCLVIAVALPFAFFASVGRGYLLPMALSVLTLITGKPDDGSGMGRIFPLGDPDVICTGGELFDTHQLLDFVCHQSGRYGCDISLVEVCRPESLGIFTEINLLTSRRGEGC